MELDIGAPVDAIDRHDAGKVIYVVVGPGNNEVIDLVVHVRKGLLDARDVVVPIGSVSNASRRRVKLRLTANELDRLPDFVETHYVPPPREWFTPAPFPPGGILWPAGFAATKLIESEVRNVPLESVALAEGMEVRCPDGRIGAVDEVVSDERKKRVLGLVVRRGTILTHDIFIPIEWIAEITSEHVLLNRTKAEVRNLIKERSSEA